MSSNCTSHAVKTGYFVHKGYVDQTTQEPCPISYYRGPIHDLDAAVTAAKDLWHDYYSKENYGDAVEKPGAWLAIERESRIVWAVTDMGDEVAVWIEEDWVLGCERDGCEDEVVEVAEEVQRDSKVADVIWEWEKADERFHGAA